MRVHICACVDECLSMCAYLLRESISLLNLLIEGSKLARTETTYLSAIALATIVTDNKAENSLPMLT